MNIKIKKDLTGQQYGKITVLGFFESDKDNKTYWDCKCSCGVKTVVRGDSLRSGNTKSCGCLLSEATTARMTTHGHSGNNKFYMAWANAKRRCTNPNNPRYKNYGGRGISFGWDTFESFKVDMWESFKEHEEVFGRRNTTLERVDNDKGYCKENCRWATREEQWRNTRNIIYISARGETKTITEWGKELGINKKTLYRRLLRGWSDEETINGKIK